MSSQYQCGYIALVGKPNTGKSTLMNALVGEKLSITADRPQTTRHQILGIKTTDKYQCIFIDTPGIHDSNHKAIHRYMNRAATSMLADADLICVLLDIRHFNKEDEAILQRVGQHKKLLIVLNKIDQLSKSVILSHLPQGLPQFPDDQLTDKSMRFITAEIIREKLFRLLTQELPYSITVSVDHYIEETDITRISATIWVERKSQKAIVIGKNGSLLKKVGSLARADIEHLIEARVYLQLWVKVREDWSDDEKSLAAFGYSDANPSH